MEIGLAIHPLGARTRQYNKLVDSSSDRANLWQEIGGASKSSINVNFSAMKKGL